MHARSAVPTCHFWPSLLYGGAGAGFASFHHYVAASASSSGVTERSTSHGALDISGDPDFRLYPGLSIRAEIRDLISGKGLGAATGRQHAVYIAGIVWHY